MKILLHACCGPCLIFPSRTLLEAGNVVSVFFYNPNIHPYSEYARRRESLFYYCERAGLDVIEEDYDYRDFLKRTLPGGEDRCAACYRIRLKKTAEAAKQGGFDGFSTTLLVSPYQKHGDIKAAGEEAAAESGVPFVYTDWRAGFGDGRQEARELKLYSQKYCGCLFSEEERFS